MLLRLYPALSLISWGHRHTLSSLNPTILLGKMYRQHEVVHTYPQHLAYSTTWVHLVFYAHVTFGFLCEHKIVFL